MNYERPQFYRLIAYAKGADRDVVDMVSGSPDWDPPEAFRAGLSEYADLDSSAFDYGPARGLRQLREGIASHHDVTEERVIVTNGTGEANHLAMSVGYERFSGEEILLTDPVYPYYAGRANLLGAESTFVPVDEDNRLDPTAVREVASAETSVIVVNSPNNPTGAVYDADAMAEFVAIAEENDALLVSDEVYERFDYSGNFTSALDVAAAADADAKGDAAPSNVVVTSAFSKAMAITGARVGYGIFPTTAAGADGDGGGGGDDGGGVDGGGVDGGEGSLRDRARTHHLLTNVTGSRPAQYAVSTALRETPENYYAENRARMTDRIDRFCEGLDAMGANYRRPDGGFYVLASLPGVGGDLADAFALIDEAGVAAMPGAAFGEARADHLRFSLLTPRIDEAVERLASHVERR